MVPGTADAADNIKDSSASTNLDPPDKLEESFSQVLLELSGIHHEERPGLTKTPKRCADAYRFFAQGYEMSPDDIITSDAVFNDANHEAGEPILIRDIEVYSMCEHHMIPFFGKAHVSYIPSDRGVVGLSKIPRVVQVFARRFQVQERLTRQIKDALERCLSPLGVAVILQCRHLCMEMRGIQNTATTMTQSKSGVFQSDPNLWRDFLFAATGHEKPTRQACSNDTPCVCMPTRRITTTNQKSLSEAEKYKIYQSCAKDEFSRMAKLVKDSVQGPLSQKHGGLSLLDIGAGNGKFLQEITSESDHLTLSKYTAFEEDPSLYTDLLSIAAGCVADHTVKNETFDLSVSRSQIEPTDIVLMSHCLYGCSTKIEFVNHAREFVAPGGVLIIFHRWEAGGTLDDLSKWFKEEQVIHDYSVFDVSIDLSGIHKEERRLLNLYAKGDLTPSLGSSAAVKKLGCIVVENIATDSVVTRKVHPKARMREPSFIVTPATAAGVKGAVRAASDEAFAPHSLSVIGGGHSPNSVADGAICLNMARWDRVIVDTATRRVRIGGGATIGKIVDECQRHGLVVPLGDRPGVGMGLVLQGGINHLMRSLGLACDNICEVHYVSPTGELIVATVAEELSFFRGAGPNFGIVLEVTMIGHPLSAIEVQNTFYSFGVGSDVSTFLNDYSALAARFPKSKGIDGYFYWESEKYLAFATTSFDCAVQTAPNLDPCMIPHGSEIVATAKPPENCHPMDLFDREVYMTDVFNPARVVPEGTSPPKKLWSSKRCLFFDSLGGCVASIFERALKSSPTKWSYVHFLHGGGAVTNVEHADTTFYCRDWQFAAVITVMFPADESPCTADAWLDSVVAELLPLSRGIYAADLTPEDFQLSKYAFGRNLINLASAKRRVDPLNILTSTCPLIPPQTSKEFDLTIHQRGVVIVLCGFRYSGKDWLADVMKNVGIAKLGCTIRVSSISDAVKEEFAAAAGLDPRRLKEDRAYKEDHRDQLTSFYRSKSVSNPAYDAQCFLQVVEDAFSSTTSSASILVVTGMRNGLEDARRLAGRPVIFIKVEADMASKTKRGMERNPEFDEIEVKSMSIVGDDLWDFTYENDASSSKETAETWIKTSLMPEILKRCIRSILKVDEQDDPVVYRDLVSGLFLQPFGASLCRGLFVDHLQSNYDGWEIVLAPEAMGFAIAGAVSAQMNKPLVLARASSKSLFRQEDAIAVEYGGSNVSNIKSGRCENGESSKLQIPQHSILPGQKVVIVDDCLASGSTAAALVNLVLQVGGVPLVLLSIMEFPDLGGRTMLTDQDVDVFTLVQFDGK